LHYSSGHFKSAWSKGKENIVEMTVLLVVATHRLDEGDSKHLGNVDKLSPGWPHGATNQKTDIFILDTVRT
jgi:hypothetical protein